MNKGTKIRTALRVAFSIYAAFCVWQTAIEALGKQIGIPWLAAVCAVIIVLSGLVVDAITTYLNNDYTEVAAKHTGAMRQEKAEQKEGYVGDYFFEDPDDEEVGETDE